MIADTLQGEAIAETPTIVTIQLPDVTGREVLWRLARIGSVAARRLAPVAVALPFRGRERRGEVLGRALCITANELGATFIKLAQLFASSPSLVGEKLSGAMRGVLDDGLAVPFSDIRRIVEEDLGRRLEEVFSKFETTPLGAASLAVVHRAELLDGTEVAVKVLRPDTAREVATDLSIVQPIARRLARAFPAGVVPAMPEIIDSLAEQLAEELDLRNEARSMEWFARMTDLIGTRGVIIPATYPDASGSRVLTMAFIEGSKVDDLVAMSRVTDDGRNAVEALLEGWFALTLCTGWFHGDMHAGNLLITRSGEVALLDWGIVGRLPRASRVFFRRLVEGALGDETAWPDVSAHLLSSLPADVLRSTGLTPEDFAVLVRSQTMQMMTAPFNEVNLMMLTPTGGGPASQTVSQPRSLLGWISLARTEKKRMRSLADGSAPMLPIPPRGEMLLMKQLVYFERYGKLFLGDKPLLYNRDVYRALLDLAGVEMRDPLVG